MHGAGIHGVCAVKRAVKVQAQEKTAETKMIPHYIHACRAPIHT
jgi:hypothetical protein